MNRLTNKKIVLAVFLASGMVASSQAQQVSLETAVTQFVLLQGQQMVTELTTQVSQSIALEVSQFKVENNFLLSDKSKNVKVNKNVKSNNQHNFLEE